MTSYSFSKVLKGRPGWYAGDFHVHTNTTNDGENSPAELAEFAQAEGLDFLAITDHNTIDGFPEIDENLEFLFIPEIEVTLSKGHFNVFGMEDWRSWMVGITVSQKALPLPDEYQSVSDLIRLIAEEGLVSSINHPLLHPWDWRFEKTDLNYVHCVELWNDLYWPDNDQANPKTVDLWTDWLNAGDRVTAIGGSDYHYPPKPERDLPGERLGQPTTHVYAEELSTGSILEGIRTGHVYVSRGPQVAFQAAIGGKTYSIGDDLGEQYGEIEFTASVSNQPGAFQAHLVRNGQVNATEHLSGGKSSIQFNYKVEPASSSWFRFDVLDMNGQVLAITNPIYANYRRNDISGIWDGAQ